MFKDINEGREDTDLKGKDRQKLAQDSSRA